MDTRSVKGERGLLRRDAFGKGGYEAVSLAEITRFTNATTGTPYRHFSDKRALFTAVADSIEADVVRHLAANAPATDDLWELYVRIAEIACMLRGQLLHVVFSKDAIGRNNSQRFNLSLRNEQTVERITMMRRQIEHRVCMLGHDR